MFDSHSKLTASELQTFKLILDAGPISRVKIAQSLKLTKASVTLAVQQLTKKGYVIEVGKGVAKAGRREVLLSVNPESGLFFSIHFALKYITIGLVNLNGSILRKTRSTVDPDVPPVKILEKVIQNLKTNLSENNINENRLWGIGISLPGVIDYQKGMAIEKTIKVCENLPIREFFQKHFNCPVIVENDVKTLSLAEFKLSTGMHINNMVCLWFEDGIGAGIFINGQLFRGFTSSAGEIGFNEFIDLPKAGRTLILNQNTRYWGDVLSFSNIKAAIVKGIAEGWHSNLSSDTTIDGFASAVETNDPLATQIFRTLGEILGIVSSNLIYSFNPEVLLFSGPIFRRLPGLVDLVQKHLAKAHLRTPIDSTTLRVSSLGEDGVTIGGALLLLEHYFRKF